MIFTINVSNNSTSVSVIMSTAPFPEGEKTCALFKIRGLTAYRYGCL